MRETSERDKKRFVGCKASRGCARRLCSVCAWWRRPRAQTCCTQRGAATPAKLTTGLTIRTARQHACHKRRSTALTRLLTTTTQLLVSCGRELAEFPARPASLLCPHLLAAPVRTGSLRIGWCTHARARRLRSSKPRLPPHRRRCPCPRPRQSHQPPNPTPGPRPNHRATSNGGPAHRAACPFLAWQLPGAIPPIVPTSRMRWPLRPSARTTSMGAPTRSLPTTRVSCRRPPAISGP